MKNIYINILLIVFFTGCVDIQPKINTHNRLSISTEQKLLPAEQTEDNLVSQLKINDENIEIRTNNNTIGLIFSSSKIGKYALDVTSSINTYLLYKRINKRIVIIDMDDKNFSISSLAHRLKDEKINKVIALFTNDEYPLINSFKSNDILFYFPLINKNDISNIELSNNFIFGAIDYKKQFELLLNYTNSKLVIDFYDNSSLGNTLHSYIDKNILIYEKEIDDDNGQYERFLNGNKKLNSSTLILNTPIVKSSILLSLINGLKIEPKTIISTQLNFTPLLLSLTQTDDRKNIIIASSIGDIPKELIEYNQIIGNDIIYNWVNYASIVGMEYLVSDNLNLFGDLSIQDNQIIYPIKLYEVDKNSLKELKRK